MIMLNKSISPLARATCLVIIALLLPLLIFPWVMPYFTESQVRLKTNVLPTTHVQLESVLWFLLPPWANELDASFFSQEDILHLQDVQSLYKLCYLVFLVAGLILVLYKPDRHVIKIGLKIHLGLICLITVVGIWAIIDWQRAFLIFHQILFPLNSYWFLDPQTSKLIHFLPNQIFQELGLIYWIAQLCLQLGGQKLAKN